MQKHLRLINSLLLAAIVIINLFVIVSPLVPGILFWYRSNFNKQQQENLTKQVTDSDPSYSGPNKLVIPKIFTDHEVLEGPTIHTADKGLWRLPWTSTPDKGSNTVIAGHRFLYAREPTTFYSLDKVQVGDQLAIYWENERYTYEVTEVKTVSPREKNVEAPAGDNRLTLYTCTPLWSAHNRLVVVAKQTGENQ